MAIARNKQFIAIGGEKDYQVVRIVTDYSGSMIEQSRPCAAFEMKPQVNYKSRTRSKQDYSLDAVTWNPRKYLT